MTIEHTFSIIKPNAIKKNVIGDIIQRFEKIGLRVVGAKMIKLTRQQAEEFYIEHKNKFFFTRLVDFMISGPILVYILEGENAVKISREIIGDTNPTNALAGTLRADYSDSFTENAVHGADSIESALREMSYFFKENEIYSRIRYK